MRNIDKDLKPYFIWLIIVISGIFVSWSIYDNDNRPLSYIYLPILPLFFSLLCLAFYNFFIKLYNHPQMYLIVGLFCLRDIITPYLMNMTSYVAFFNVFSEMDVLYGIFLMLYEPFCVFGILYLYFLKSKDDISSVKITSMSIMSLILRPIVIASFIFCLATFVIYPDMMVRFQSVFDILRSSIHQTLNFNPGTDDRILTSLSWVIFPWLQVSLSILVVHSIRRIYGDKLSGVFIVMLILLLNAFLLYGANSFFIILFCVITYVVYIDFKKQSKVVVPIFGIFLVFSLSSIALVKSSSGGSGFQMSVISLLCQSYCPGVANFAAIFNMPEVNKLSTIFYDIYDALLFKDALFGLHGDNMNVLYAAYNDAYSQILPCAGQVYYYLGFLLSPAASVFFSVLAYKDSLLINNEKNIAKRLSLVMRFLYLSIAPLMFNPTILLLIFLSIVWPLQIIAYSTTGIEFFNLSHKKIKVSEDNHAAE